MPTPSSTILQCRKSSKRAILNIIEKTFVSSRRSPIGATIMIYEGPDLAEKGIEGFEAAFKDLGR